MATLPPIKDWLVSSDSHGNRMVADSEREAILKRLNEVKDSLIIVEGDLEKDRPNTIIVDITHHAPHLHKGKNIWISLAHYIRPCLCKKCKHEYQYECYIEDCACCTDECT